MISTGKINIWVLPGLNTVCGVEKMNYGEERNFLDNKAVGLIMVC